MTEGPFTDFQFPQKYQKSENQSTSPMRMDTVSFQPGMNQGGEGGVSGGHDIESHFWMITAPKRSSPPSPMQDQQNGKLVCGDCRHGFKAPGGYNEHWIGAHSGVRYRCNYEKCQIEHSWKKNMKKHIYEKHAEACMGCKYEAGQKKIKQLKRQQQGSEKLQKQQQQRKHVQQLRQAQKQPPQEMSMAFYNTNTPQRNITPALCGHTQEILEMRQEIRQLTEHIKKLHVALENTTGLITTNQTEIADLKERENQRTEKESLLSIEYNNFAGYAGTMDNVGDLPASFPSGQERPFLEHQSSYTLDNMRMNTHMESPFDNQLQDASQYDNQFTYRDQDDFNLDVTIRGIKRRGGGGSSEPNSLSTTTVKPESSDFSSSSSSGGGGGASSSSTNSRAGPYSESPVPRGIQKLIQSRNSTPPAPVNDDGDAKQYLLELERMMRINQKLFSKIKILEENVKDKLHHTSRPERERRNPRREIDTNQPMMSPDASPAHHTYKNERNMPRLEPRGPSVERESSDDQGDIGLVFNEDDLNTYKKDDIIQFTYSYCKLRGKFYKALWEKSIDGRSLIENPESYLATLFRDTYGSSRKKFCEKLRQKFPDQIDVTR